MRSICNRLKVENFVRRSVEKSPSEQLASVASRGQALSLLLSNLKKDLDEPAKKSLDEGLSALCEETEGLSKELEAASRQREVDEKDAMREIGELRDAVRSVREAVAKGYDKDGQVVMFGLWRQGNDSGRQFRRIQQEVRQNWGQQQQLQCENLETEEVRNLVLQTQQQ